MTTIAQQYSNPTTDSSGHTWFSQAPAAPAPAPAPSGGGGGDGVAYSFSDGSGYNSQGNLVQPASSGNPAAISSLSVPSNGPINFPNQPAPLQPNQIAPNVPLNQPNPTLDQQALSLAQATGTAPQDAGTARTAVTSATQQAAGTPTFYKPDPNSPQVINAQGQKLSYDQYIAQGGKADFSNTQPGNPPPLPITPPSPMDQTLAQDKSYQQLLKDYQEYNSVVNQQKSLVQQYQDMLNQSGIPAINTELLNTQKIINGTEDDIRKEVTAAGGFATNSQVLALSSARNKVLIQNYNQLLSTRDQAMTQVNTMIGLAQQDQQHALSNITQKLQIDQQIADYQQKFTQNAQQGYKTIIDAVGYQGLYNSLMNSDPSGRSLSLAEQTLGLASGQLQQLGSQIDPLKAAQLQKAQTDAKYAAQINQANINQSNASAAASAISTAKNKYELQFMQANGGLTPAQVNSQLTSIETAIQKINSDASDLVKQLATKKLDWGAAFNTMKAQHPELENAAIDNLLQSNHYR